MEKISNTEGTETSNKERDLTTQNVKILQRKEGKRTIGKMSYEKGTIAAVGEKRNSMESANPGEQKTGTSEGMLQKRSQVLYKDSLLGYNGVDNEHVAM